MERTTDTKRILAVDPRSNRFGFVVLEGGQELMDWGVKHFRVSTKDIPAMVRKRIAPLFLLFSPQIIVLGDVRHSSNQGQSHHIVNAIKGEARRRRVALVTIGNDELQRVFGNSRRATKYQIASQIALFFPELTWSLPPVRKIWMSEHYNMTIFDAASVGVAYYLVQLGSIFPNDSQFPPSSEPE